MKIERDIIKKLATDTIKTGNSKLPYQMTSLSP